MVSKKILVLSRAQIKKIINMPQALRIVKEAFIAQAKGRVQMPAKIYIHLSKYHGDFRAMPAYIQGIEACGIKWVNVHPDNRKYNLPAVMALIILSDPKSGFSLAIMDGTYITNLRTGAAGGIAARYLANKNSSKVALIGCGKQAESQLMALDELFKIKAVSVNDCNRKQALGFIRKMKPLGLNIKCCANIKDCVCGADIIVTTTPSRKPILKSEWIGDGVHINAIGADARGKEELEPLILKRAKIFVDDRVQAIHSGEINVPISKKLISENNIRASLGEVISRRKRGRLKKSEITVFDSTGIAAQDVAVANYVYKEATRKRLGEYIRIF